MKIIKSCYPLSIVSVGLVAVFSFQNCSGVPLDLVSTSQNSGSEAPALPVGHPAEQVKMVPSQKIIVGGKNYVAELVRDIFGSTTKPAPLGTFNYGFTLTNGQAVKVGTSTFVMQNDGNAVLYDKNSVAVWDSYSKGGYGTCTSCKFAFQGDGNAVVYNTADGKMAPIWDSGTGGSGKTLQFFDQYPFLGIVNSTDQLVYPSSFSTIPDLKAMIEKWILFHPSQYGGSCNPYDTYATADCGGDVSNADLPGFTDHNSLRESYRLQFCQNVLAIDAGVSSALEKIAVTPAVAPTRNNISQVYGLFYRDDPPDDNTLNSLLALDNQLATKSETTLERWRAITLQICESPGWQLF